MCSLCDPVSGKPHAAASRPESGQGTQMQEVHVYERCHAWLLCPTPKPHAAYTVQEALCSSEEEQEGLKERADAEGAQPAHNLHPQQSGNA